MSSSKLALKRARPALGSILLMRLEAPAHLNESEIDAVLAEAFEFCEELENKFSKFREASDVSRINQASLHREIPVSREFLDLMILATEVWRVSNGAFNPFGETNGMPLLFSEERASAFAAKTQPCTLDLSGIAKGYVVDKVAEFICARFPEISGVINAGGDLLFLNTPVRHAQVRLAQGTAARALTIDDNALATSAMSEWKNNELSTTVYSQTPRAGLTCEHAVSVIAPTCAVADALTKVGWFGSEVSAQACAANFSAKILVFDGNGHITQSFGAP